VPASLEDIVVRALAADPARRPTSAGELADLLDATDLARDCPVLRMELDPKSISGTDEDLEVAADHQETQAEAPAARDRRVTP
jgi:hypothetical protein